MIGTPSNSFGGDRALQKGSLKIEVRRHGFRNEFRLRRKFDVVMAWSIDRLGRSFIDLLATVQNLEACGVEPGRLSLPLPPLIPTSL
jgi:hypothetical protein